ncbi:ABC transporter transmembrane domain-containing protein [Lichenicoccus sp.]|uniref:ABC transporter transmembrane domain-containing protein n=1 Tax=Lichenicoccus sp. TaxID=2781899 RepID=UPI003D09F184
MNDPATRPPLRSLRLLFGYLRPYGWRVAAASTALLAAAGLVLGLGQGVRRLIDGGFGAHSLTRLNHAALAMGAIVAALAFATSARFFLVSWLGERVAADLRRDVFDKVVSLSPSFFETARTGDIIARLTADVSVLQALTGSAISLWVRNLLTLVGAFVMLLITSAKLAGIIVLVIPLVLAPVILFGRREKRLSRQAQDRVGDLSTYAEETVNFLRAVQAFTHEATDRARFSGLVEQSVATAIARVRTRAVQLLSVILLGFGAITLSLWVGGRDVVLGRLSGGDLSAFVFYAVLLASSGAALSELWGEMQRAAGAADRILELLGEQPTIAAPANPKSFILPARGHIDFTDVRFCYPSRPTAAALDGISLTIEPGSFTALVGPSGAGKSTLFQLLLRFHDPQSGSIRIDGTDIASVDPRDLRRRIGLVPQDPVIFSTTARENIRYSRPDASDADVRAAAEAAAAADFLDDLPQGFDSFLGEKGIRLSGGQRQRVAIARAILRDAPILLLDEATSALDAESERAVQSALTLLARNRTTLVVAHRLATVRRADRIIVLEAGRIVAAGTHTALMRENGLYARLAELQFAQA